MRRSRSEGFERLVEALELYVQHRIAKGGGEDLLGQHPEHQELLAPLLQAREAQAAESERRRLGDFTLVRELGRGGMGVVYEAVQRSLDRRVALKVLAEHVTRDPGAVARFRREALTAARLEHENLLAVHAVGSEGDTHFFAMELVDGGPLSPGRFALRETVLAIAGVADALEHAHRQGVVHRDVKPGNILVRKDGSVALADFGLAREETMPGLTASGAFAGTPYYSSPEQVRGEPIDARTDVWSLGATLYELVTGRKPFPGATQQAVMAAILREEPADVRRHNPALPPEVSAILHKALEKAPARRYSSAAAFAADLRAFVAHRPIAARRPGPFLRAWRFAQREPAKAVAIVLLATVAVAIGFIAASLGQIRAGREKLEHDRLESMLAEAFLELQEGTLRRADELFLEVSAAIPRSREAQLGRRYVEERIARLRGEPGSAGAASLPAEPQPGAAASGVAASRPATGGEPDDALACCFLALELTQHCEQAAREDFTRALALARRAVALAPSARLLYHTQWAHAAGHLGEAKECGETALALQQLWPDSPLAWRWSSFALAETDPGRAARACERWVALQPERLDAWIRLSTLQRAAGDLPAALASAERALALGPEDARAHYALADAATLSGDHARGLAAYERVIAMGPESKTLPMLWFNVSWIHYQAGRWPDAIAALRRSLDLDPNHAEHWRQLGYTHERTGDFLAAAKAHLRSLRLHKDVETARRLLDDCQKLNDPLATQRLLAEVAEIWPASPSIVHPLALAWFGKSTAADHQDPARAVDLLWRLVHQRRGADPVDWVLLGLAQAAAGELAAAAVSCRQAQNRLPAEPQARGQVLETIRSLAAQVALCPPELEKLLAQER
jgi:tetratricopeptide (TPR) repeat protein